VGEKLFSFWDIAIGIVILSFFVAFMVVSRESEAYKKGQVDAINGVIKVEMGTSRKRSANWVFKDGEEYE
jgi:hypothetical protein